MNRERYQFDSTVSAAIQAEARDLLNGCGFEPHAEKLFLAPLAGGLNNTNLVISSDTGKWILKIRPKIYATFGADPESSLNVQRYAAGLGVAGNIVAVDDSGLHFVTEFIEGETVRPEIARQHDLLSPVVELLKHLHSGDCPCRKTSFFDDIRLFMKAVYASDVKMPDGFKRLLGIVYDIEKKFTSPAIPTGLCHNDLVPQNFIHTADGLKLIDFDYAGVGLIAGDLASAASQFEMTEAEVERFLRDYDKDLDDGQRSRVDMLRFCNNIREVSFVLCAEPLLAKQTYTQEDLNFSNHRDFNIKQAETALADESFYDKCNAIGSIRSSALF